MQFTKDLGVARDAGLRPGDQLLSCNGVDFADVLFSEVNAFAKLFLKLNQNLQDMRLLSNIQISIFIYFFIF